MTPAKEWKGRYDANGGYLVVKKDGDIVCYHFYNRNDVEDYLYYNTRFERASRSRYHFLALDALKAYTGDFHVEVKVPNEGGVIDKFIIQIFDPSIGGFLKDILIAFLTYYFTKRANKRENILKGIEIIEKNKGKEVNTRGSSCSCCR